MYQPDIWILLPGVAGGRAVRDMYGQSYLLTIASRGGQATVKRYGNEHMRAIGKRGGEARRKRLYTQPKTIKVWDGSVQRRIPYWPHHKRRQRRKRPVFVRIELE
jgi:general stress protein YciG